MSRRDGRAPAQGGKICFQPSGLGLVEAVQLPECPNYEVAHEIAIAPATTDPACSRLRPHVHL
jgi:hypothetical protein